MKKITTTLLFTILLTISAQAQMAKLALYEAKADSIISLMTIDEKIGQLNQETGNWDATGPILNSGKEEDKIKDIKDGRIGSMLNVRGSDHTRELQKVAMSSRMHIPLLFGQDVVHGYKTVFPVPLAQSASFDPAMIEKAARVAARETAVAGIQWVFSPMLDVARDPRWGRVMEGPGEDPFVACQMATAMVKGYEKPFDDYLNVIASAKHFAAYSGAIGGRDYNTVDCSLQTLNNLYLPPFKAAVDAGISTIMCSFNEINGVPSSANTYLYNKLYKDWGFKGLVVSDWGSIGEMVTHGYSKDRKMAAEQAINAGVTIDMESYCYQKYLKELISERKVSMQTLDHAVKLVLIQKLKLGLFDNPYKYCDQKREDATLLSPQNRAVARDLADKSIILLKNDSNLLPIVIPKKITVIGSLADSKRDMDGNWIPFGEGTTATTLLEALKKRYPSSQITFEKGFDPSKKDTTGFKSAVNAARNADLVILTLGESFWMTGEACSRGDIDLPGFQQDLACQVYKANKNTITLVMGGRPTIFNDVVEKAPAILYCWWLGTEAGDAMVDVITGKYDPSARVPMSFPKAMGQIPVYYNHKNSGRPPVDEVGNYSGRYQDIDYKPQYCFAYGLSYTKFVYSNITTEKGKDTLRVKLTLKNTGKCDGSELVQVYLHKMWGESTRPVKELKGFQQVFLKKGESRQVEINIPYSELKYYGQNGWVDGHGDYQLFLGKNSQETIYKTDLSI